MEHLLVQYKRKGVYHAPNTLEENVFAENSKTTRFVLL